jgi:hypothetical protein
MDGVDRIRVDLSGDIITVDEEGDDAGVFAHVDAFVNLSRGNESVQEVFLCPFTDPDDDAGYAMWDKAAEGIGNLQELREITIVDSHFEDDEGEALVPDWEILACILRRLRRGIMVRMCDGALPLRDTEALPVFARAIYGQAMITGFKTGDGFPFHCLDILCSALLTLPALEYVSFGQLDGQGPEEGQSLENMVKLLQSPTLQEVDFEAVVLTNTICQAVAKALKERSEITDLDFLNCSFPEGGGAVIASALKTNTTLKRLRCWAEADEVFFEVLAAALLSNSTLKNLSFDCSGSNSWLLPVFLALQVNNGLTELTIYRLDLIDEKLSTAMKFGLGRNSTLESLIISGIKLGDNDTSLWREALSFLRTNTVLKALCINFFSSHVRKAHATAFIKEVMAMLRENESIETVSVFSENISFEDYLVFVAAIQPNSTLKRLRFYGVDYCDTKDLIAVLKKNYGLEEILGFHHHGEGDIRSILQLNRAGRRYLVQDGSSISKGVDVLSRVRNDINSVFLHLLENPRLCDRSAVETSSIGNIANARSTSPGNHSGGKRGQQAPSHAGKEPRRRLE